MNDDADADGRRGDPVEDGDENPYASPRAASPPQEKNEAEPQFSPLQRLRRVTTLRSLAAARFLAAAVVLAWGGFPWPGTASTQLALRLACAALLLGVGLGLWRLQRWTLWALRIECLALLLLLAAALDLPLKGNAPELLPAAYVLAMQVAILQLLQSTLTQQVCAPGALRRQPPLGPQGWAMIAWKAAVFNLFWLALQLAALTALLRR